ncbi:agmatine deiminase family protein [Thermophagus sp. OGC60D27]|uniref:agmatine deiminase family protein n=1 Tax=Thermophagus sp. OGC60D27 TaxID=3458415 RepID=UPI004037EAFA
MNNTQATTNQRVFPAEWEPQDAILLAWPHKNTDWVNNLDETRRCFRQIIDAITRFQDVILIVDNQDESFSLTAFRTPNRIHPLLIPFNDTWARDFGPLLISESSQYQALDFKFNGWGLKFPANKDNLINRQLFDQDLFAKGITYVNHLNFVLEGGSVESNGKGTILTTSECLLSPNRNGASSKNEIEATLKHTLGAENILWLDHGFLAGDDTDSHIDTLARFCNFDTIAYIKSDNPNDEHFEALSQMEKQLQAFRTTKGDPFNLIPLPMADPVYDDDHNRLPATYANFLIINQAVLLPFYGSQKDQRAKEILQEVFSDREIIGIDCRPLIQQHGSLHCVTMQLPQGVINRKIVDPIHH